MNKSLFDYQDYKLYIKNKIADSPSRGRGIKLKISKALLCQTAYVSQVLNGSAHFSLEQGINLNNFLEHSLEEGRFFLLLIQFARSGTTELKKFFKNEIREYLEKRSDLKTRLKIENTLSPIDQQTYYSTSLFTTLHMMVAISGYQTPKSISRYLNLPLEKIIEALTFLEEKGLIIKKGTQYEIGVTKIHLSKDSPLIQRHHANWRLEALRAIDLNQSSNLHYTSIVSMGNEDAARVKEVFIKAIEECRAIIKNSKEEQVQAICLDFFKK